MFAEILPVILRESASKASALKRVTEPMLMTLKFRSEINAVYKCDAVSMLLDLISKGRKADLVYIDPPYNSNADYFYKAAIKIPGSKRSVTIEKQAYGDKQDTEQYLRYLCLCLYLIKDILSERGSLYIHLDSHMVHYVKIMADEIFGIENFINDIVWQRTGAQNNGSASFGCNFDIILFYGSPNRIWNTLRLPYSSDDLNLYYHKDKDGRFYRLNNPTGKGSQEHVRNFGRGPVAPPDGRHWSLSQEQIDLLIADNRIVFTKKGYPFIKKYLDEMKGKAVQSIWNDCIPPRKSFELTGYPTQKPEKLLDRIIHASSEEGSLVVDCFCGSGTTALAAAKSGRIFAVGDFGNDAVLAAEKRLINNSVSFARYATNSYNENIFNVAFKMAEKTISVSSINYKEKIKGLNKINLKRFEEVLKEYPLGLIDSISADLHYNGECFNIMLYSKGCSLNLQENMNNNLKTGTAILITDKLGNSIIVSNPKALLRGI